MTEKQGAKEKITAKKTKKPVVLKKTDNEKEDMDLEGEEAVNLDDDFDELLSEVEAHTGAGEEDLLETEELWGGGFSC